MRHLTGIASTEAHTIWGLLSVIPNSEVPVLAVVDLGMIHSVACHDTGWVIGFTPTYSGCPATEHLLGEIRTITSEYGFLSVHIVLRPDPPWTINWVSQKAREYLHQYGISLPQGHACHTDMPAKVSCLHCGSTHTSLVSEFDSTTCEALYRCDSCHEPFDYFKCI